MRAAGILYKLRLILYKYCIIYYNNIYEMVSLL